MKPRAYSYVRFSTTEQSTGDSLRRQTEAARRFAASAGMELDDTLTMQDLGRSAYAGHHVTEGALGGFLAACEAGLVPKGSVLVVEAVDRLTRLDHLEAVNLIGRLVRHVDLHVVQLGRTFTDDSIRHDMGCIFTLIGAITLGHQESQQKGSRVGSAWEEKRRKAASEKKKLTSIAPAWLHPTPTGFEAIPDRAAIVREIFENFVAGVSQHALAQDLNERRIPVWGRGACWHRSYVAKILRNEAVIGTLSMGRKRKRDERRVVVETVPNYFPAIISETLYNEAQALQKTIPMGRRPNVNPLSGILRCPRCGGSISRQHKGARGRAKLVCSSALHGAGQTACKSVRRDLERLWDEMRPALAEKAKRMAEAYHPGPVVELQREADQARSELETIREAVSKLDRPSAMLIGEVAKLEAIVQGLEKEIRMAGRDVSLAWENVWQILVDDNASPSEISARLRVVYPDGIVME
jgi:DNA invertase Pin-like site-specific DNA recombinase